MVATNRLSTEVAVPSKSIGAANVGLQSGLTSIEARRRLDKFGANAMPDTSMHPLRTAIEKFWAPVPWMLALLWHFRLSVRL
jgi:H+-transporting ATPase